MQINTQVDITAKDLAVNQMWLDAARCVFHMFQSVWFGLLDPKNRHSLLYGKRTNLIFNGFKCQVN